LSIIPVGGAIRTGRFDQVARRSSVNGSKVFGRCSSVREVINSWVARFSLDDWSRSALFGYAKPTSKKHKKLRIVTLVFVFTKFLNNTSATTGFASNADVSAV